MPKDEFSKPMSIRLPLFHFRHEVLVVFHSMPILCTGGLGRSCPDPCASHLSSSLS